LITLQYVIHSLAVSSITYLFPLWAGDTLGWGAREVGLMFGVQGAIMVLFQGGLIAPLTRLAGEWRLLCICIGAFLAGLFAAAFSDTMWTMVPSMYLAMTGATMCMPLLNTIVSHRTPVEFRGRLLGTTSAAASWGRVAGPMMAGVNLAVFGYSGAYLGCAAVVLLYLAWALREYRGNNGDVHQLP
jgi:MFS family permease